LKFQQINNQAFRISLFKTISITPLLTVTHANRNTQEQIMIPTPYW